MHHMQVRKARPSLYRVVSYWDHSLTQQYSFQKRPFQFITRIRMLHEALIAVARENSAVIQGKGPASTMEMHYDPSPSSNEKERSQLWRKRS